MAVMADHSLTVLITGLVATLVAAQTAQKVRTRSRVARTGLTVGLCEVACVFGAVIMNWREMSVMITLNAAGSCVISGFLCAIIALLILPVFEYLFRITTDISLLELSDLGHPLLQRLAIEAPGTYHHSLVVANLAQAAADEIGANSLVARVCAYFHDIGKLIKPNFFAENIQMQNNPHDDLPPSMSTLIITSHVKEGLSLAMHHKLPDVVAHVISEHHGTSLITYFHHKARTNLRAEIEEREGAAVPSETVVDDSSFRYSGPRPTSRESAIICLADAVEAASRTLEKTAIPQIENMVDDITNARILDGQLDSAGLTLAEISRVKRSFVFTLASMLHGRVPYPKDETRDRQPPKNGKGARPEGSDTLHAMPGPRETTRAGAAMDSRLARTDG
jgi:putative nucleotidyltransferase with HDIG domain